MLPKTNINASPHYYLKKKKPNLKYADKDT